MTSVADKTAATPSGRSRSGAASVPELWGAIAIGSMWLAVLFTSIYGGDVVSVNAAGAGSTTIPSAVFVALFACLASVAVARRAFPRTTGSQR